MQIKNKLFNLTLPTLEMLEVTIMSRSYFRRIGKNYILMVKMR